MTSANDPRNDVRIESEDFDASRLEVVRLEGRERLSQPFRFVVTIACEGESKLDLDEVVGADVTLVVTRGGEVARRIHGMVREIARLDTPAFGRPTYAIEVAPILARASYVQGIRVHLDVKVADLLRRRLELLGLVDGTDFVLRLSSDLPARAMVVQYRESDLAFLQRLFEEHGLAYWFREEDGHEVLVITDSCAGFEAGADARAIRSPRVDGSDILELARARRLVTRSFVCRDYNYRTPNLALSSDPITLEEGDLGGVFEYGLHADTIERATALARHLADAELARRDEWRGRSALPSFSPGRTVRVESGDEDTPELLLIEVDHAFAAAAGGGPATYENRFVAIPAGRMPRPHRTTPAPRIHGFVHAVVQTDAAGTVAKRAKIDSEGRYHVKFRFDPAASDPDQAASCPVRMLQPSAGPGYGMHFPLRPGVEVLVGFIGGDPDRPVIVGAAPNPITPSPVADATSHKNRIRTASGAMIELDDGT
jgi:type VI secretion system secreted protein VgrG